MQTAYTIHNGTGPSQRMLVSTKALNNSDDTTEVELEITVAECDDYFVPTKVISTFTSAAARAGFRGWLKQEPSGEANYHYKLRASLNTQYNWRFEVNPALSDPL